MSLSLRARILLLATGIAALVIVLAAVPIALLLRNAAYSDAEHDARDAAQSTADYLSTGRYDDAVLQQYLDRLNGRGGAQVSVVKGDGDVLGAQLPDGVLPRRHHHRPDAGPDPDHDHDDLGEISTAQVTDVDEGRLVHMDSASDQGVVEVFALAGNDTVRAEVLHRALLVGGTAIVLLLLAAGGAEVTSRRLVRPLERTADTAVRLSAGDLMARAPVEGPVEVARVAVELNALADRIDELLAQERETAADLSHRLRTPLTSVRLAAEALPPGAGRDELERQVTSLERTLTQVIRTARRPQREGVHPRCDAAAVARDRVEFWSALTEDQGREMTVAIPETEVPVRASAEDLGTALDALLENVVAHTPERTPLSVVVTVADGHPVIEVLDAGPGIPADAIDRGRSDRGSSGLGLDIARSFAEGTGGTLSLVTDERTGQHGVRLTLRAPQGTDGKT